MSSPEQSQPPSEMPAETGAALPPRSEAGILDLLQQLLDDGVLWIKLKGYLARAEVAESVGTATRGLVLGAAGGFVILSGGATILMATGFAAGAALQTAGVAPALSYALGFFLTGLVASIIGWIALQRAKALLSPANLAPSRTTASLRRAVVWAGSKLSPNPNDNHEQNPTTP